MYVEMKYSLLLTISMCMTIVCGDGSFISACTHAYSYIYARRRGHTAYIDTEWPRVHEITMPSWSSLNLALAVLGLACM
jgi:hypothetical protein